MKVIFFYKLAFVVIVPEFELAILPITSTNDNYGRTMLI